MPAMPTLGMRAGNVSPYGRGTPQWGKAPPGVKPLFPQPAPGGPAPSGPAPQPQPAPPGQPDAVGAFQKWRLQQQNTAGPVYGGGVGGTPGMDGFGVSSLGSVGAPLASWSNAPKPWEAAAWQDAAAAGSKALGFGTYGDALKAHGLPSSGGSPSTASQMFGTPLTGGAATGLYGPFGGLVGAGGLSGLPGGFGGLGGPPSASGGIGGATETALLDLLRNPAGADLSGERDLIAQETARGRREAMRSAREALSRSGMLESGQAPGILAGVERDAALGESRLLADLLREQAGRRQQGLVQGIGLGSGLRGQDISWLRELLRAGSGRPSIYTQID